MRPSFDPRERSAIRTALALAALLLGLPGPAQVYLAVDGVTYETCTGLFYDSGGAAGNYGNNQNITTTLCPAGGAGAGPATSVLFLQWQVAPGPGDQLFIYDGLVAGGAPLAVGTSAASLLGLTFVSADPSGCLTFRFVSDNAGTAAGWAARILTAGDPGGSGAAQACATGGPFALFPFLTGNPDPGGVWSGPNGAHSGSFDPATDPPGDYFYTLTAPTPCADTSATVTVTIVHPPDAGTNGAYTACATDASFSLFALLGGSPDAGGTWIGPGGPHSGTFVPGVDPAGAYLYTVAGTTPCNDASATVTITVNQPPVAGTNASITVCSVDAAFGLFPLLGGTAQGGGTWTGPGGAHSGTFIPGTDPPGAYVYEVPGTPPCSPASATVTVGVQAAPNAGTMGSVTVCSNLPPFSLFTLLGGSPQAGGTWTAPGGSSHSGIYDPAIDPQGPYTYTVAGTPPCTNASAVVNVTRIQAPNAGTNGTLTLCSDGPQTALFGALGGAPNAGGTWSGPGGAHSGQFIPGSDPPGLYTYTVAGTPPCANASATVNVVVNQRPNAGTPASITVCSNDAPFSLFATLGGGPQGGGAWTGPGGTPVAATYTPGTSVPGVYTYTVIGLPPCAPSSATVTVAQVTAPNAGLDRSITLCSDHAPFPLVSELGGTPDAGGQWSGPGGAHGPTFTPGVDQPGVYTYTVAGTPPCANDQATLTITVNQAPDAGLSAAVTVCSTDGSFPLIGVLGGTPDAGGSWTRPNGTPHPGIFNPGISVPGIYTYTVVGLAPCAPSVATVEVTVNIAPVAGTNATVVRCSNDATFSLFASLGGTPDAGGTWTGPNGPHGITFTPGVDTPGAYTYTVLGQAPCANATAVVNVSVVTAPDAGISADTTVCSNHAPFGLFACLDGTPDANGTWTGPGGGIVGSTYTPGTSTPGIYTYTVPGIAPCVNAVSTITVSEVPAPDPGTNGAITLCSDHAPVDLFTLLGGTPQSGGSWAGPGGAHSGLYLPATQPGGTYTYTVAGMAPCVDLSASVQVVRVIAPNAGVNGNITVCSTNGPFQLLSVLGGNPNGTGSWSNAGGQAVSGTFTPGTTAPGTYTYVVNGTAPCVNDTAWATVVVNQAPNAGINASTTICSSEAPFALVSVLGGTPNGGGTWVGPDNQPHPGTFIPGTSTPGGYTYTVSGQTPCLDASAVVVINVNIQPSAGLNAAFERCSTDPPVDLFTILGGTPNTGGTWVGPGGPTSGVFFPGTSLPGDYVYTVTGTPPCQNASATVTATVNQAPNAGIGGALTVCTDQAVVDLFDGLSGNPDENGTWNDDDATGQQSNQFFSPLGLPAGTYSFTYTVPGIGQCGDDLATVLVTTVAGLDAGSNGTMTVCGTNTQVNLFNGLGGNPQPGGVWIDLDATGSVSGQFFNAANVPPGTYNFRYVLGGTLACASDSSQTTVTVVAPPNAGTNGSTITCSNNAPFSLFPFLGGNPQGGGVWRLGSPTGPVVSGIYNPALDNPNTYFYVVSGTGPCANAVASVQVTEVQEPNAGASNQITVCSNGGPLNMTLQLGGNPQPGQWTFNGDPHGNIFVPGLDAPGIYVYTVQGQPPCGPKVSTLTISVQQAANAGTNGSTTVCSNQPPFLLFGLLAGGAQFGGAWTGPDLQPHDGLFIPGTSLAGDYFYTVPGTAPCANDVAVVSVFVNQAANAGCSGATTLCSGGGSVNLFTVLGCSPDPTGSWTGPAPGNGPFSGTFVPGTSTPGTYTYTVQGAAPCGTSTATVTVAVNQPSNAGQSNAITRCSTNPAFAMVDFLLGTPALNGTWTGPGGLPSNGVFTPGTSTPGTYTYTVPGQPPCPNATATLNITVNPAPVAGVSNSLAVCNTGGSTNLFSLLGPTAQPGGTWTNPLGVGHSGTLLPGVDISGSYTYTVTGLPPCASSSAVVEVVVNTFPDAGFNGLVTICTDTVPFQLFDVINGTPQLNGLWTNPSGQPHTGIFLPGTNPPGVYTYTVPGIAPCGNASAQVTVLVNTSPNAGQNGVVTVCSDQPQFNLFNILTGSPMSGGTWLNPSGGLSSGIYVPGSSQPGVYTYFLVGQAPCRSDSATVTVIQNAAANAGISTVAQICSNEPIQPLISLLGGTPDLTGTWTFNDDLHGPFFDPATNASGAYVYTVAGLPPCSNSTAQVQITLVPAPNAGSDGVLAACIDDPSIALVLGLGGTPDAGGTWADLSGTGQLTGGTLNSTGLAPGSYAFLYTVQGFGPCADASATVTVNVTEALSAGYDSDISVCQGEIVDLFAALDGSPQTGGFWLDVDLSGALIGGVFNSGQTGGPGTWRFDYVLSASALCQSDTARVTVNVIQGPFAGCDGAFSLCSTNPPVILIGALTCGPNAGGFWLNPALEAHSGTYLPATDPPGIYRYVVPGAGICPSDTAQVNVQVTQAVFAGVDANVSICSNDPPLNLFPLLGPLAMTGGQWSLLGVPHPGIYNPAVDVPGVYRYTVQGQIPCPNDDAFVTVVEPQAPNAGCNASVALCSDQVPINMRLYLGCSPQAGGSWIGPDGPVGEFFDPATGTPGVYTYTIVGTPPCANASASLTISVTQLPNAGQSASVTVCLAQDPIDLYPTLGAQAQPGGNWVDLNGSGALDGSEFDPAIAGLGTWVFQYGFPSNGPCPAVFRQVTVTVITGPSPGEDNVVTVCGAETAFNLFGALAGEPVGGGSWSDVTGTGALLPGGILNASLLPFGGQSPFVYTVTDPQCGSLSATVLVSTVPYPIPGIDNAIVLCTTSSAVDLLALLGDPQLGGTWAGPGGSPHGGTFLPGTDAPGAYTYTVSGNEACPDSSATVTVIVNAPPVPGTGGTTLVCDTLPALLLFPLLEGGPQGGGTWSDPAGTGALSGGAVNTTILSPGEYLFGYTVSTEGCPDATAFVTVTVVGGVEVNDVELICDPVARTYTVRFTITGGDPATYVVNGLAGELSDAAPWIFSSTPLFTSESFEAYVQDGFGCNEARVTGGSPCDFENDVFVPQSFSPNGDNINDTFVIPGIEGWPGNSIVIFNRWGAKIYEARGYDNREVVWDGSAKDALFGGDAPAGTYYYVLELGNDRPAITGYIYLNR